MSWIRIGALFGIAGVVWDLSTLTVLTLVSGADPVHDYLSVIALTDWGAWYVAAGTVAVLLHLPFVVALWLDGRAPSIWAGLLGAFFIMQWLGAALFPCDPGCALITTTGKIHYALGLAAFVCLGLATIGYGVAYRQERFVAPATVISVAMALVLLAFDLAGTYRGLFERLALLAFGLWSITVALALRSGNLGKTP